MRNLTKHVDAVTINPTRERKSFIYAKCKYAIQADMNEQAKGNVAGARNWARHAKNTIITFLGGKLDRETKLVLFPDGTKAKP